MPQRKLPDMVPYDVSFAFAAFRPEGRLRYD